MADIRLLMTADAAGGVWTYALDTASALAARGIATTLAVCGDRPSEPALHDARAIPGAEIVLTGLPLDWTAASAAEVTQAGEEIARLAFRAQAALVQLNAPALAATASFPVPTIGVLHSCVATWWDAVRGAEPLPADLDWRAKLTRAGLNRVDVAVTPSLALAGQAARVYALPRAPLAIHNGRSAPTGMPRGQRDIAVVTAGRLWDEGKNIVALERAAALMTTPIHAAGPIQGPNGAEIRLQHLRWLGSLDALAMRALMERTRVFVSTALYEPFGLAVLEAAQAGCALVLSDNPTFRELWDGAATFVEPRNPAHIAEALARLAADTGACARFGAAARDHSRRYTIEASAEKLANLMHALVTEPRRRAS